jgi:uncharacterized damage-inducible protein DinB
MSADLARRPDASAIPESYRRYVEAVADGDVIETLERQGAETQALLGALDAAQAGHRYAPGKWTVKQVVGHLADGERVFAYRTLCFARKDQTALPPFEEDDWAAANTCDQRSLRDVLAELAAVRQATLALLRGLDDEAWDRQGTASGKRLSVRALAWIVAGHEAHHLRVLRERYL